MLIQAKDKHGFDLTKSFVMSDRMMDVGMAHTVGAKGTLVPEPGDQYDIEKEIREATTKPDFRTDTFMQAIDWILERLEKRD